MSRNCHILDFYRCRHPQDSKGTGILWTLKILTYSGLWMDGHIPDMSRNCHILDFYMCRHLLDFKGTGILWTLTLTDKELLYSGLLKLLASSWLCRYSGSFWILFRDLHIRTKSTQMSSYTGIFLTLKRLAFSWLWTEKDWHILNSEWTGILHTNYEGTSILYSRLWRYWHILKGSVYYGLCLNRHIFGLRTDGHILY